MILTGLSIAALGILAGAALVLAAQRSVLFPGTHRPAPSIPAPHPTREVLWLDTGQGRVESWFFPPEPGTAVPYPAMLFAHGNGELIDDWPDIVDALAGLGIGILLVEYPGYGRSEGRPSESSVRDTMIRAVDLLASRPDVDRARLVLYGRSLGGGAIGTLLETRSAAAVILQSTFTDVPTLARDHFRVPSTLIRDRFDTRSALAGHDSPVLVIHGRRDDLIPYAHGEALAKAAPRGELLSYDCQHNDCPPDWQIFAADLRGFLERSGVLPPNRKAPASDPLDRRGTSP